MEPPNSPQEEPADPLSSQDACSRRTFFARSVLIPVGLLALLGTLGVWTVGLFRFFRPNASYERSSRFRFPSPESLGQGEVDASYTQSHGVWIVRDTFEDQDQIFVLRAVCTHLGCTPIWDENESLFKCPCHGSRFDIDGINLEGPAPRPLERVTVLLADDGELDIDPDTTFRQELGQWQDPNSRVLM